MAKNRSYNYGRFINQVCTHPAAPSSGQPCRVGNILGVSQGNEDSVTGKTSIDTGGVYKLSVKGNDGAGSAVIPGDSVYYTDASVGDGSGFLDKVATGKLFGYALGAVESGATTVISVRLVG